MKKLIGEFKEFIAQGNVMSMAVGIIIGSAFTAIVTSLVNDIIMPLVGLATGGRNFNNYFIFLSKGDFASIEEAQAAIHTLEDAQAAGIATLNIGAFVSCIINFLIIAVIVFFMVKLVNAIMRKKEEAPADPEPTAEEVLLTEIRDLLKEKK